MPPIGFLRSSVRRSALALAAGVVLTSTALAVPAAVGLAAGNQELKPRIYTVTPSSEPGQITGPSSVKVWDGESHQLIKEVRVPSARPDGLSRPHHFMPVPGRNFAFLMGFAPTSSIKVFDMVKNEFTNEIQTGLGARHLEFHPSNAIAYSANFDGDSISVININAQKTERTIPVGDRPNYVDFVRTKEGPRLFVANFGENYLTVIDAETYEVIGKVTVGDGPFNMGVTHDQRYVVSSDARTNTASFVDTATLKVSSQVELGGNHRTDLPPPAFQRLNPRISPDGKWLFIGNQDASETTIIDIGTQKKVKAIPSGLGADLIFFPLGPAEGYAFITNRYDRYVTVAKLNGDAPPTFVGNIPHEKIGSHYMTFDENWETGIVSQRPGRAYSVFDMSVFENPDALDAATLGTVETRNVWVGGSPGPSEEDNSDDYTRAGPDMAVYVWFENGRAHMTHERGGD